jgi:hypothetical protein
MPRSSLSLSSPLSVEKSPGEWMHHNKKGFQSWVTKTFIGYDENKSKQTDETEIIQECNVSKERIDLFPHQRFIRDYMQHKSPYRGILLYHGLGVGKTCASIAIAEIMRGHKNVMVMLPASLQTNYRNEIMRCGSEEYSINQYWTFKKVTPKKYEEVSNSTGLDAKVIKSMKGYWENMVSTKESPSNFNKLTSNQQKEVRIQIREMISKYYEFMNYNGLTLKSFKSKSEKNIFNEKLVIIDESHLFISTVANKSQLAIQIYKDLINAKNCKIVLLTGTPVINYPNEIAYTLNLLAGLSTLFTVHYNEKFGNSFSLEKEKDVDSFEVVTKSGHSRLVISLTPSGFVKKTNGYLEYTGKYVSDEKRISDIVDRLKKTGVKISNYSNDLEYFKEIVKLFPTERKEFDEYFIDYEKTETKNDDMFMKRITGLVSYYESSDKTLYPENLGTVHEELYFSNHQFGKYAQTRDAEIKKEENALKNKKNGNQGNNGLFEQSGSFKTFSRAMCNFVFPEKFNRPFPGKNDGPVDESETMPEDLEDDQENDDDDDSPNKKSKIKSDENTSAMKNYEMRIQKSLNALKRNKHKYFSTGNLENYSPKFAKMIEHIGKSNGTALVYSQFRKMEGLGIFGIALQALGYAEMKISIDKKNKVQIKVNEEDYMKPKYVVFSTDRDVYNVILNIFNSDLNKLDSEVVEKLKLMDTAQTNNGNIRGSLIKVLMITQSGSAGISLKNVRQVHIMEPYWNKSRTDQVIGRANRTCSHIALPKRERNFTVYMYRMKIHPDQLGKTKKNQTSEASHLSIKNKDKMLSTDQIVFELANKKDRIVSKMLHNVKRASIDCALNKSNNLGLECLTFPLNVNPFENSYMHKIEEDYSNQIESQKVIKIKVKPYKVTIDSVEYIWIANTNELFDLGMYRKTQLLDELGSLHNMNNGWYKLVLFKNKDV